VDAAKETKFGTKVTRGEDDARTSNTHIAQRKRAIPHAMMKNHNMACVLLTRLCNQLEACTSDLSDDQSRHLSFKGVTTLLCRYR